MKVGPKSSLRLFLHRALQLSEKNKFATCSVQRCLEMCENKQTLSVSKDFQQKKVLSVTWKSSTSDVIFREKIVSAV